MTLLDPRARSAWRAKPDHHRHLLMLLVVVPVIIMTFLFAWKYRASNTNATYTPNWSHSTKIEVAVWLFRS
jgi:cytochrome o ubiquinol oxidase subunit 2